jgi:uncharacterized membrane protein YdbT with pleckstrin-like domain
MSNPASASYDAHPVMFRNHPLGFLLLLLLIIAPVVALLVFRDEIRAMGEFPPAMLLGLTALGLVIFLYWYLKSRATRLRITDDIVHLEVGLLSKQHIDLHVRQIRAVRVYQGLMDRIFRVGRIEVFTTGDVAEFVVGGMRDPNWVREHVRNRREVAG